MMSARTLVVAARTVARTYGGRGAFLRALHEARRLANAYRREPRHHVDAGSRDISAVADRAAIAAATDRRAAVARGDRVVSGEYLAYGHDWRDFPDGAAWHRNAATGFQYAAGDPWWKIPHILPSAGDIKDVWEPARFAWAYDLARAFAVTGAERYRAAFEHRLADWSDANPPFLGVHWSCAQETSIRAIALLSAETLFAAHLPDASRRLLRQVLSASGERVADSLAYGISQRNNHGISESAGLVALGVRLRGAHPRAAGWIGTGQRLLERQILEQFAPDGWYIQHSFNYLRVALDQCIVAELALRRIGSGLSEPARARLRAACELLIQVMEGATGIVPNHGANDGALVHPVSMAAFRDMRPTLTAACSAFGHALPADIAGDAESLAWTGLPSPAGRPARTDGIASGSSGWAVARVGGSSVFLRAGSYRSRPGHLDPLHVDIRLGGREVVVDAGSFAYVAAPPWMNGLVSARVHNGPMLDGREPGVRGPRFLWFSWPEAALREARFDGRSARLVGEVPGLIRRTVTIEGARVVVEDESAAEGSVLRVLWLLHPEAQPDFASSAAFSTVEGREGDTTAWYSPHYGQRISTRAFVIEAPTGPGRTLRSVFTLPERGHV